MADNECNNQRNRRMGVAVFYIVLIITLTLLTHYDVIQPWVMGLIGSVAICTTLYLAVGKKFIASGKEKDNFCRTGEMKILNPKQD